MRYSWRTIPLWILPVVLVFGVSACATGPGGSAADPYGYYDLVRVNGERLPSETVESGWCRLTGDGTLLMTLIRPGSPEPDVARGSYSLGPFRSGCYPYEGETEEGPVVGSLCGGVLTVSAPGYRAVLHRRSGLEP